MWPSFTNNSSGFKSALGITDQSSSERFLDQLQYWQDENERQTATIAFLKVRFSLMRKIFFGCVEKLNALSLDSNCQTWKWLESARRLVPSKYCWSDQTAYWSTTRYLSAKWRDGKGVFGKAEGEIREKYFHSHIFLHSRHFKNRTLKMWSS